MPQNNLRHLFAQHSFMRFWLARLAGVTANQMLMVAVAWHMYDITSSAWDLGLVGLFQFVPALLMTLPAGHFADRWHRGRIFAACMLAQALVAILLVVATQGGFANRELILSISMVLGIARAFQMPAQQALIPVLVPPQLLQRALALSSSGMQAAIVCGPAMGGVLYTQGPTAVYLSCAFLLLLSGALTLAVRYHHRPTALAANWRTSLAGISFVWKSKVILGATSLDLFAVLLGGGHRVVTCLCAKHLAHRPCGLGGTAQRSGCGRACHVTCTRALALVPVCGAPTAGSRCGIRIGYRGVWPVQPLWFVAAGFGDHRGGGLHQCCHTLNPGAIGNAG